MEKLAKNIRNLVDAIYDQDSLGGPLRMVLENGNLDDKSIKWCLENTIANCSDIVMKVLCTSCVELLNRIQEEDRRKILCGS